MTDREDTQHGATGATEPTQPSYGVVAKLAATFVDSKITPLLIAATILAVCAFVATRLVTIAKWAL